MSLSGRQLKVRSQSMTVEMSPSSEDNATTRRSEDAGDLLGIYVLVTSLLIPTPGKIIQ